MLIAAALYAGSTHELSIWSVFVAGVLGGVIGNFIAFWWAESSDTGCCCDMATIHLSESRIKIGNIFPAARQQSGLLLPASSRSFAASSASGWRQLHASGAISDCNIAGAIAWVAIDAFGAYYLGAEIKEAAPAGVAIGIMVLAIIVFIAVVLARHEKRLAVEAERAFPGPLRRFGPDAENSGLANYAPKPFSCLAANRPVGLAVDLEPDENYARGRMLAAADAFR